MKYIKLHLITFVIVACIFMLCPFAYAEEMASNVKEEVERLFYQYDTGHKYESYLNLALSECPYFLYVSWASNELAVFYFASVDDNRVASADTYWWTPVSQNDYGSYQEWHWYSPNNVSGSVYYSFAFYRPGNEAAIGIRKLTANGNIGADGLQGIVQSLKSGSLRTNWQSNDYSACGTWKWHNISKPQTIAPISYVDDERLKFALVDNIYGGKNLMIDIRQFINDFPIQDTSHSSVLLYPESISLTYSVDNVEKTLILDSSNSTIKSKYIFETDLSNFDYDDSSENVIITKCDFTISGNTQSGQTETQNYKISCDYYLKRFVQPIETGFNPYESDVDGDQTSQETKDSLEYLVTFREGYGLDFDEFSDLSFPDYYTYADVYLYNNTAAYNYVMDNILSVNAVAYIIQNIANSEDDVITQIGLFLDDSNYGEYYDVIVFDWIQETSSSYTHTYFYFETVSGRVKASTQFLQIMQDDLNKVKINTAAAFTAIDNFEAESIQFFNSKLGLDADLLGWVKTIDNSINNLDFPTYDDSNLLSVLGQIKDLLSSPANEIDTPQECIQLYEAHPNYFDELWGTSTSLRSASRASNPFSGSEYVRADLVPAWWEGKTLTMIYLIKNDGNTSRFYNDMLNGLYTAYDNLISSNNAFNEYINSLFKYNFDYSGSFYGHLFSLDYNPEEWNGGFNE